jgi:putative modified peptide
MADTTLNKQQLAALYQKLATDDEFRSLYEKQPAKAMAQLGIPADTIVNLPGAHLTPVKLADKSNFASAHQELLAQSAEAYLCMIVPNLRLDNGSQDA